MVKSSPKINDKSTFFHGTSRGPTGCFCWASKLLSGTSEAPQAVSIGLRNCYLARFQHPLKPSKASKPSKPPQQLSTAFRCFAMGPPEAPRAVSVGLRNCYLALPKRHKMLGFETAIWLAQAVSIGLRNCYLARFQHPLKASKPSKPSQQLSTAFRCFAMGPRPHELFLFGFETAIWHFRSATSCFYWAKLLSGTFSAPLKSLKTLTTLAAAFDGLSLLCHGPSRSPTSCFCWASKLLSGTSEAPQAVSIGLRNCYLAHFQHPLIPSKPSQQLSTAFRCFAMGSQGPTSCFCWTSKLLSGTSEALGFETAIWHFRSATSFFYWASKLLSGTFSACPLKPSKASKPLPQLSTAFRCFAMGPPEAPQAVSVGLRNCYLALPKRHKLFLLGFETAIWQVFSTP